MTVNEVVDELRALGGWEWELNDGGQIRGRAGGDMQWTCPMAAVAGARKGREVGVLQMYTMACALDLDYGDFERLLNAADRADSKHQALRAQLLSAVGLG